MKFCIENISIEVSEEQLRTTLEHFGTVQSLDLIVSPVGGPTRAWVEMEDQSAQIVLKYLEGDIVGEESVHLTQLFD